MSRNAIECQYDVYINGTFLEDKQTRTQRASFKSCKIKTYTHTYIGIRIMPKRYGLIGGRVPENDDVKLGKQLTSYGKINIRFIQSHWRCFLWDNFSRFINYN